MHMTGILDGHIPSTLDQFLLKSTAHNLWLKLSLERYQRSFASSISAQKNFGGIRID